MNHTYISMFIIFSIIAPHTLLPMKKKESIKEVISSIPFLGDAWNRTTQTRDSNGYSIADLIAKKVIPTTKCIWLQNQKINNLDGLDILNNATEIWLSCNNIETILTKHIAKLKKLERLDLDHNNIYQINPRIFCWLKKLKRLDLRDNPICNNPALIQEIHKAVPQKCIVITKDKDIPDRKSINFLPKESIFILEQSAYESESSTSSD